MNRREIDPDDGEYLCVDCIEFTDGNVMALVMHQGTQEECESVADMLPGISYSGDKTPARAFMSVITSKAWCEQIGDARVASAKRDTTERS